MTWAKAIDEYVAAMVADGRFTSLKTERSYRWTLEKHADDCGAVGPLKTNRDHVKRTLHRWGHPNTRALCRAHLVSFYRFQVEEGKRRDNPAEQTRRPRKRPAQVYRLTRDEVVALRDAVRTLRERRVLDLGLYAGLRASEICGMQGRHFRRPGWVWVSADVAKGGRERFVAVPRDLERGWWEIARAVQDAEFVVPVVEEGQFGPERRRRIDPFRAISYSSLHAMVVRLGRRAGIRRQVHPHLLRHAYGTAVADHTGDVRVAQALLGHQDLKSTQAYMAATSLDKLSEAVAGMGYGPQTPGERAPLQPSGAVVPEQAAGSELARVVRHFWAQPWLGRLAREMAHV